MRHPGCDSVSSKTPEMFISSSTMGYPGVAHMKLGACGFDDTKVFSARAIPANKDSAQRNRHLACPKAGSPAKGMPRTMGPRSECTHVKPITQPRHPGQPSAATTVPGRMPPPSAHHGGEGPATRSIQARRGRIRTRPGPADSRPGAPGPG